MTDESTTRGGGGHPVVEALERLGVEYEIVRIDPAYAETAAFCEKYGYAPECSANTIVVASKKEPKQFVACVVLATTQLDVNRRVRKLMGVKKASFASGDEMRGLTGMEVGGVTPFGLPEGMPLWVDRRVMEPDWIILGGGGRDFKVKITPSVFERLGAVIVEDLAVTRPPEAAKAAKGEESAGS